MADPPMQALGNPAQDENADPTPADTDAPTPNQPAPPNPAGPTVAVPKVPVLNLPVPNQPALMQPALAAPQIIHQQGLNWSHFKLEFAGRPEEDAEAHLHTNDWMITHNFPNDVKVQRFCLTFGRRGKIMV